MNQILLIDKPSKWTSFDVVAKIRSVLRKDNPGERIKVGHTGTLDPFATGLLILLVGDATKKQGDYMKLDKEYVATLKLGYTSTTGDPEGEITKENIKNEPSLEDIEKVLDNYRGEIKQIPPAHSAIKVDGKRAYKLARAGEEVNLKPREVTIHSLNIMGYSYPELKLKVECSSGTYIRSLARDIGEELGVGAYLAGLRREKIGDYSIKEAHNIEEATKQLT